MRNPVNRLATAAPRAFDSILNPSKTGGTSTEKNVDKSTTTSSTIKEQRNRGSSFHLDLSLLLNINDDNAASSSNSVREETGSVLTFEEMMIMQQGSSTSSWDELNSDKVAHTN